MRLAKQALASARRRTAGILAAMTASSPPTIALVAGELSGDLLGAALIQALRERFPQARFYGVAGPRMVAAGCEAIDSIEALSVMGIAEVLPALPRLFKLRARLVERFAADRPDIVIGIDAPDFNLGLERRLRDRGLRTAHFVSPTVWAWRSGRVKGIVRSVDLLLCLFPFEPAFYAEQIRQRALDTRRPFDATYVGHPLADELDARTPPEQARAALGLDGRGPVLAVLPGSRGSELRYLGEPFVQTAQWLSSRVPGLRFVTPIAKPSLREGMQKTIAELAPGLDWTLVDGRSREVMQAADAVLIASGTATLECLLLGRPMVVAYKGSPLTAWLMLKAGLLKVDHVSLPNLLGETPTVPELLQDEAVPEKLGQQLLPLLTDAAARARQLDEFDRIRERLRCCAAARAADAVAALLARSGV
jgi:lipid-A-disaccharide synthase